MTIKPVYYVGETRMGLIPLESYNPAAIPLCRHDEAMAEIERLQAENAKLTVACATYEVEAAGLRQQLAEARNKALDEAASYHDDLCAQHVASHEHVVSDHHEMMERQHRRFAYAIRALKDSAP